MRLGYRQSGPNSKRPLGKGDSLAEVRKEIGHSNPGITYRTCYKWMPKKTRSEIDEMDGELGNATIRNAFANPNKKELATVG